MDRTLSLKIVGVLALVQGGLALLRAYNWVQIGSNLFGQGLLLLPVAGVMAVMRGLLVSIVALLYILFAVGALLENLGAGGLGSPPLWSICFSCLAPFCKENLCYRDSFGRWFRSF